MSREKVYVPVIPTPSGIRHRQSHFEGTVLPRERYTRETRWEEAVKASDGWAPNVAAGPSRNPRERHRPSAHSSYGKMFWFTWNTLSGSYFRLSSTSRR